MKKIPISYRCFRSADIADILRIQSENLRANLSESEQRNGFLSVAFSARQFIEMNHEIPVVVADLGNGLGGFLCSSTIEYSRRVPLLALIMNLFPNTIFKGKSLDTYDCFFYGPVCIDSTLRGSGILRGLFDLMIRQVAGRFEVGALFISVNNPRSLRAHTYYLGMEEVTRFRFQQDEYSLLAFKVPQGLD